MQSIRSRNAMRSGIFPEFELRSKESAHKFLDSWSPPVDCYIFFLFLFLRSCPSRVRASSTSDTCVHVLIDLSSHLTGIEIFHRGCNDTRVAYKRSNRRYWFRNRLKTDIPAIDNGGNR